MLAFHILFFSLDTDNRVVLTISRTLVSSLVYVSGNNLIDMFRGISPR